MIQSIIAQWKDSVGEIQFVLALGLFFLLKWFGNHSLSIGYTTISLFVKEEKAPAFNFVFRVFAPLVYLIITSSLLYAIALDLMVAEFYLVSIYYIFIQISISVIQERSRLINWPRQVLYSLSIIGLSYILYIKFIHIKSNVLPDFNNVANELWIIIILFVYKIFNDLTFGQESSEKRKESYLNRKFEDFRNKYGRIINSEIKNDILKATVYAILLIENFNRPKSVRWIEKISFMLTRRPHTLGIMQVLSKELITDEESVALGARKVRESYEKYRANFDPESNPYYYDSMVYDSIIADYNGGHKYREEVGRLIEIILEKYYKGTKDTLNPIPEGLIN